MRVQALVLTIAAAIAPQLAAVRPALSAGPDAAKIYHSHCAKCHGSFGGGSASDAKPLNYMRHSLADCDWMSMMSDATLFLAIHDGGPAAGFSHEMPAFAGKLSDTETAALVRYIRRFCGE